ncbi:MAG: TetR/AcrR family transcriptional regulator [Salinibacterium sp.]|nr:MAG: TetR/AcrR family transcriptional regulator [Salinibacterium sp.]
MTQERRLTAEDWAEAALEALGEGGLSAIAVEPLAARLGVTKGSFYWHFANREALVAAALALWEQRSTEAKIASLNAEPDPVARIRLLFSQAIELAGRDSAEINLRAASDNPLVQPLLRRVIQRRLWYTIDLFEQIGFSREEAIRRGAMAFTAYGGQSEITARFPGIMPIDEGGGIGAYVDSVLEVLLSGRPG